jgi:3-deoxy-7-phosphoheptulonate synthase
MINTNNLHIKALQALTAPETLLSELSVDNDMAKHIQQSRENISQSVQGNDKRQVVIIGPCSIHDTKAALEYAARLKGCIDNYSDTLHIIMRVYFEKPRTPVGWKGLINDPGLDCNFNITEGLRTARQLLLDINALGVPTGSEFLDTIRQIVVGADSILATRLLTPFNSNNLLQGGK